MNDINDREEEAYEAWYWSSKDSLEQSFLEYNKELWSCEDEAMELLESDDFAQYCSEQFKEDCANGSV